MALPVVVGLVSDIAKVLANQVWAGQGKLGHANPL
jgi:hypothetical protein